MQQDTFRAIVVQRAEDHDVVSVQNLPVMALPEGDVLVEVAYSSLNYKDGLAVTGQGRVVRRYPMIPGIDFAGTVTTSPSKGWLVSERKR